MKGFWKKSKNDNFYSKITQAEQLRLFYKNQKMTIWRGSKGICFGKVSKKCNARFLKKLKKGQFWGQKSLMRKKWIFNKNQKPPFSRGSKQMYICFGKISKKSDEWFLKKRGYRRTHTRTALIFIRHPVR